MKSLSHLSLSNPPTTVTSLVSLEIS
jgi:hypothetical protein